MANSRSAKQNILINQRNQARNNSYKSRMKTIIKKCIDAIETKADNAAEILQTALKTIDKTASKGIIKKTSASRKKSNLTLFFNRTINEPAKVKPVTTKKKTVKKEAKAAPTKKTTAAAKKPAVKKPATKTAAKTKTDTKAKEDK
jgi:small subunit ribosomal protein S20